MQDKIFPIEIKKIFKLCIADIEYISIAIKIRILFQLVMSTAEKFLDRPVPCPRYLLDPTQPA